MPDFEEMEKAMNKALNKALNKKQMELYTKMIREIFDEDDDEQGNGLPRRWRQTSCSCRYYDNNSPCAYCDPVDGED